MERMKQTVHELLSERGNAIISRLQQINEKLLKEYELHYSDYLLIQPLQMEIFYVNYHMTPTFVDTSMHCISSGNNLVDTDIWKLQSARFGKLYFHLKGQGGIDICLSDSRDFALCATSNPLK